MALLALRWVEALEKGMNVLVYCSDVSGAFDRVRLERLVAKLRAKGVPENWIALFTSWLRDRKAVVVVGGTHSKTMVLGDMVFQGTVWGPPLWNTYFGDCVCAIEGRGFTAF